MEREQDDEESRDGDEEIKPEIKREKRDSLGDASAKENTDPDQGKKACRALLTAILVLTKHSSE